MSIILVPEFSVSDWGKSKHFYCDIMGFDCLYERPEEGFCYLSLNGAELMIDQIGLGRTFHSDLSSSDRPFGRGMNLQIEVPNVAVLLDALNAVSIPLCLDLEDKWYRKDESEVGNRQFMVADPDGYYLRFFESLGSRKR